MKTSNTTLLTAALAIATFSMTLTSCDSPSSNNTANTEEHKHEDTKEIADDHNEAKFSGKQEKDADFLVAAADINLKEIKLGKLANDKAVSADVKSYAKKLESDHATAQKDLEALAGKKQITVPKQLTESGEEEYKNFADKKGKDFDKDYIDAMVKGHKDAIEKFDKAAKDAEDEEIKAWAESMLPHLRTHLDKAMALQSKLAKKH